jgi:hypothetical protein
MTNPTTERLIGTWARRADELASLAHQYAKNDAQRRTIEQTYQARHSETVQKRKPGADEAYVDYLASEAKCWRSRAYALRNLCRGFNAPSMFVDKIMLQHDPNAPIVDEKKARERMRGHCGLELER